MTETANYDLISDRLVCTDKKKWSFDIDLENSITLGSLNYTSAAFFEHHTIDIMLCYCGPNVSSIGSIDDRYSTFVTKMSVFLGGRGESKDLQFEVDCKIKRLTHYIQEIRTEEKKVCF